MSGGGQDRIIRLPVGQPIPEGYRLKQLLGQETGLAFGAAANFTADVVLVAPPASSATQAQDRAIARRERVIREYQRRARAAVRVLMKHGLADEYLDAYYELGGKRRV